jgi:hypothetical protein
MWVQTLRVKGKEFDHFARSLLSNIPPLMTKARLVVVGGSIRVRTR